MLSGHVEEPNAEDEARWLCSRQKWRFLKVTLFSMLVTTLHGIRPLLGRITETTPAFKRVLMVSPEHYRIAYAINPYMKDSSGKLKEVDPKVALVQWTELKNTYEKLGFPVSVIPGVPDLPDMVYAANQSFPFWDNKSGKPQVLLARMASPFRAPEVEHFRAWYEKQGITTQTLTHAQGTFEGNGDAILHPGRPIVWGASGPANPRRRLSGDSRAVSLAGHPAHSSSERVLPSRYLFFDSQRFHRGDSARRL